MHGFQHSRGRIAFDTVCALAVSASLAGAWLQTGAQALLLGAAVALLYGFVRMFDMRRRREEPQRIDFPVETSDVLPAMEPVTAPPPVEPDRATADLAPPKPARKVATRRAAKKPKLVEVEIAETVEPDVPAYHDEVNHPPLTPLFEPVPVVRELRTFGRKAG
jgi:hypothetical protein